MRNLILYKFAVIGVLAVVALWSFHALPHNANSTKAVLSEEFFKEPVASSSEILFLSHTPSQAKNIVPSPIVTKTSTPLLNITPSATPVPTYFYTSQPTATLAPTATPKPPTPTPLVEPTFNPTPSLTPVSETTPSPTPVSTPVIGHVFYLSTYHTAKYYYCDTDNDWKSLSEKYLKSYNSEQELLADYPSRKLHELCK